AHFLAQFLVALQLRTPTACHLPETLPLSLVIAHLLPPSRGCAVENLFNDLCLTGNVFFPASNERPKHTGGGRRDVLRHVDEGAKLFDGPCPVHSVHDTASTGRRTRPVSSSCIMPAFIARIFSSRSPSASISLSPSLSTSAIACCSRIVGSSNTTLEMYARVVASTLVPAASRNN